MQVWGRISERLHKHTNSIRFTPSLCCGSRRAEVSVLRGYNPRRETVSRRYVYTFFMLPARPLRGTPCSTVHGNGRALPPLHPNGSGKRKTCRARRSDSAMGDKDNKPKFNHYETTTANPTTTQSSEGTVQHLRQVQVSQLRGHP